MGWAGGREWGGQEAGNGVGRRQGMGWAGGRGWGSRRHGMPQYNGLMRPELCLSGEGVS